MTPEVLHGLEVALNAVVTVAAVPALLVPQPIDHRHVPDHDAEQVLVDGLLSQGHDVSARGGSLAPEHDGTCWDVNLKPSNVFIEA